MFTDFYLFTSISIHCKEHKLFSLNAIPIETVSPNLLHIHILNRTPDRYEVAPANMRVNFRRAGALMS
jgi:hypothetical protein